MERRDVEAKLAAAEARRREVEERLQQNAARLAELEDERAALVGETRLAERAAADYEEHLERLHKELAAVEVSEARGAVQEAVAARDAVVDEGAALAAQLVDVFERLEGARADLAAAHGRLQALDSEAPRALPSEPTVFADRWRVLAPMVEAELGARLESELVEAAARSGNPLLMEQLPQHLRELARQKKRDNLARRARAPKSS